MPQLTSVIEEEVISHSGTHQSSEQSSRTCQDHSKDDSDDSKLLALAVQSLPAYVERCCMMLVLVPTDEHRDRAEEVVDWCSWRGRGWCRLEFMSATLCRHPLPVMVVKDEVPEFIFAADALLLPPGLGEFSCCAMKHDFGNGKIPCDKIAVGNVLSLLMEAKLHHLKRTGAGSRCGILPHCRYVPTGHSLSSVIASSITNLIILSLSLSHTHTRIPNTRAHTMALPASFFSRVGRKWRQSSLQCQFGPETREAGAHKRCIPPSSLEGTAGVARRRDRVQKDQIFRSVVALLGRAG